MQIGNGDDPELLAQKAVDNVKRWCLNSSEEGHYNLSYFGSYFKSLSASFNQLTEYLLGYSAILSDKEIDRIIELRQKKTSNRILYLYGVENVLAIPEIHDYFKDIALLFNDICNLHNDIKKRIYKK